MAATASAAVEGSVQKYLAESLKRFARSTELCDDYLRGYYGLKLVRRHKLVRLGSWDINRTSGHIEAAQGTTQTNQADRVRRLRPARCSHGRTAQRAGHWEAL